MLTGRPPKFQSPEHLAALISVYFTKCREEKDIPNKAGLALFLGTTRETLHDYEKKEGFSYAIKDAYATIEDAWVQRLGGNVKTVAGIIFYLKNAFAYRDRIDTDLTSDGEKLTFSIPQEIATKHLHDIPRDTEDRSS